MKTVIAVKRGNTTIKIYRHKGRRYKRKHYELFTVAYRLNGKQRPKAVRRSFATSAHNCGRVVRFVVSCRFARAILPMNMEARGFEPLTSSLQSWRSTN